MGLVTKCNKCQGNISEGSRFCPNCGEKIAEENKIGDVCYNYFAMGIILGALKDNKKVSKMISKKMEEISPQMYEIYKNPLSWIYPEMERVSKQK